MTGLQASTGVTHSYSSPPFLYAFGIIIFHKWFHLTYFTYTMGYTCAFFYTVSYKPLNARASGEDAFSLHF